MDGSELLLNKELLDETINKILSSGVELYKVKNTNFGLCINNSNSDCLSECILAMQKMDTILDSYWNRNSKTVNSIKNAAQAVIDTENTIAHLYK